MGLAGKYWPDFMKKQEKRGNWVIKKEKKVCRIHFFILISIKV